MSPGDQQGQKRISRRIVLEHRCKQMPFHMMYGNNRATPGQSEPIGQAAANHQGPDQPRACGIGDRIGLVDGSIAQDLLHQR